VALAAINYRLVEVPVRQHKWSWMATPLQTRRSSRAAVASTVVLALCFTYFLHTGMSALIGLKRPMDCQRFNDAVVAEIEAPHSATNPLTVVRNAQWIGYVWS
jgi:hypothetical protein